MKVPRTFNLGAFCVFGLVGGLGARTDASAERYDPVALPRALGLPGE